LDRGETRVVEGVAAAALLLLGSHLGTDARSAVLTEATGVNWRRRNVVIMVRTRLGRYTSKASSEINLHLLGVRLDLGLRKIALRAPDTMRRMSVTRLMSVNWHTEGILNALAVRRRAVGAAQGNILLFRLAVALGIGRNHALHPSAAGGRTSTRRQGNGVRHGGLGVRAGHGRSEFLD
jgi:hypothetical protein